MNSVDDRVIKEIGQAILRACIAEQKLANAQAEIEKIKAETSPVLELEPS